MILLSGCAKWVGMSDDGATRWYINPDGPEAASRIEKLEAALRTVKEEHGYGLPFETIRMIDAVLEGQK